MCADDKSSDSLAASTSERRLPRVSNATGGLMPGLKWERLFQQVQELDDLEYIEKLKRGFRD